MKTKSSNRKCSLVRAILTILMSVVLQNSFAGPGKGESSKLDLKGAFELARSLAGSEIIVSAVKEHNQALPEALRGMDNGKWKTLSPVDPIVKEILSRKASEYLKSTVKPYVSEAFLSGKDGKKAALTRKTTKWDHSTTPKHETPMKGVEWTGEKELDESTGINQIQISVPVKDKEKVVGSLVLGISLVRYERKQ